MDFLGRYELLSMVKKHSKLLGKTIVDEQDASDIEMDQGFWHDVLNLYFVQGKDSRGQQDDDLVFFVKKMVHHQLFALPLHGYSCQSDNFSEIHIIKPVFYCFIAIAELAGIWI